MIKRAVLLTAIAGCAMVAAGGAPPVKDDCIATWSPWTDCSASCDGGSMHRICLQDDKQVDNKHCHGKSTAECGTEPCPSIPDGTGSEEPCVPTPPPCEEDSSSSSAPAQPESSSTAPAEEFGAWSAWHACSVSCGSGVAYRDCVLDNAIVDNSFCPTGNATMECNTEECPVVESSTAISQPPDGTASESSTAPAPVESSTGEDEEPCVGVWGPWSDCSASCDGGKQSRCCFFKGKQVKDKWCEGESHQDCCTEACPVSSSTAVSQPPDGTASESSTAPAESSTGEEEEPCVGVWGPWSDCSASCDGGKQSRCCFFKGKQVKDKFCEGDSHQDCNTEECPVSSSTAVSQPPDGTASESSTAPAEEEPCVGAWGPWSDCSASCDGGKQSRCCFFKGKQVKDKFCDGKSHQDCNTDACPVSSSTATSQPPDGTGSFPSSTGEAEVCWCRCPCQAESSSSGPYGSTAPAEEFGAWSAWHACSVSCGSGVTYRDCIKDNAIVDNSFCPTGNATMECNTEECPVVESSTAVSQPPDGTASEESSTAPSKPCDKEDCKSCDKCEKPCDKDGKDKPCDKEEKPCEKDDKPCDKEEKPCEKDDKPCDGKDKEEKVKEIKEKIDQVKDKADEVKEKVKDKARHWWNRFF